MPYDAHLISIEDMFFEEPAPTVIPDSAILITVPQSERDEKPGFGAATIAIVPGLPSEHTRLFLKEELHEVKMSRRP